MSAFKNQRGFTLLEILISIAILSFISLGVVSITENAANTMERTTAVNQNNLQIETAMNRFEWDFSQIYSPLYFSTVMNLNPNQAMNPKPAGGDPGGEPDPIPQNNPQLQQYYEQLVQRFDRNEHFKAVSKEGMPIPRFYSPDKSTFEFFTSSNRRKVENQKQSHFAWVRYSLASQGPLEVEEENSKIPKSLKSFVRYFTADDPYSDKKIDVDNVKGAVLLRNVEQLEFQFWDFNRRKWETSLRSIENGESLIHGIRILITWYDSFGNQRTASRIFRSHWPIVIPQDQPTIGRNVGGMAGGTTTGDPQNTSGTQGGATGDLDEN